MGELLSIHIKIADRSYPMRVPAEEEAWLRQAAQSVNERLKEYRDRFGLDHQQDLLAMVAFDCVVEQLRAEATDRRVARTVDRRLDQFERMIDTVLPRA